MAEEQPATEETLADAASQDEELFDGSIYDDPKLKMEFGGRMVTDVTVAFTGGVELRRWTVDDLELWKGLHEGQKISFVVHGIVAGTSHTHKKATAKRGEKLVGTKKIKVDSLERA